MPLNEAKAAAMAMAKGYPGDILHLNGMTARLLDTEAA
jgi:hypothetical protein